MLILGGFEHYLHFLFTPVWSSDSDSFGCWGSDVTTATQTCGNLPSARRSRTGRGAQQLLFVTPSLCSESMEWRRILSQSNGCVWKVKSGLGCVAWICLLEGDKLAWVKPPERCVQALSPSSDLLAWSIFCVEDTCNAFWHDVTKSEFINGKVVNCMFDFHSSSSDFDLIRFGVI